MQGDLSALLNALPKKKKKEEIKGGRDGRRARFGVCNAICSKLVLLEAGDFG